MFLSSGQEAAKAATALAASKPTLQY